MVFVDIFGVFGCFIVLFGGLFVLFWGLEILVGGLLVWIGGLLFCIGGFKVVFKFLLLDIRFLFEWIIIENELVFMLEFGEKIGMFWC